MRKQSNRGFTLIELMIAVAIVGILIAIAFPAYQDYVRRARRADAMASLNEIQLNQAKWRANNPAYAAYVSSVWTPPSSAKCEGDADVHDYSMDCHYVVSVINASATSFVATAIPNPDTATGLDQQNDQCGSFAMDEDGPVYNYNSTDYASVDCWR